MRHWITALLVIVVMVGGIHHWSRTQAQEAPPTAPTIYTSDKSGSFGIYALNQANPILDSTANETDPALAPSGQFIAFASDFDGDFDIYLIQPDGTGGRALTVNDSPERQPRWISDNLIVFAGLTNNQWDLFQLDINTGAISQLTNDAAAEVGPDFSASNASSTSTPDATVNTDRLNIRQSPGTGAAVVGTAEQGEPLTITGRLASNEWVQVVTMSGVTGWAYSSLLTINIDLSTVPILNVGVVEPPRPTNTPSGGNNPPPPVPTQPQGTPSVEDEG